MLFSVHDILTSTYSTYGLFQLNQTQRLNSGFKFAITRCPECDDSVRVIAKITDPDIIPYIRIILAEDYSITSDKDG